MRLLNTSTFQLRRLAEGEPAPPYATLSHCWGTDEVVYDDLQNTSIDWTQKYGFRKLMGACAEAVRNHQLDWLWADTVCIDRSSSAELSESINSMYRWYRNCTICLAYLGDVCSSSPIEDALEESRWMQRSWTLVELIAPQQLHFFNVDWSLIGAKKSLISTLSRITQIDQAVLEDADSMSDVSIGKRMSWVARRTASKVEDVAYSLLGIFGLSMPIIYGEGERAFMRLQEELLRTLDDASLFAWKATDNQQYRGLLARSPSEFWHFSLLKSDTTSWRLPTALKLTYTTPTLTCSLEPNELHEQVSLPLSDVSNMHQSNGSLGIRLCMWNGRLVRSSPQQLFHISSKIMTGSQEIPVSRDINARDSRLISQAMANELQQYTPQAFHSHSGSNVSDDYGPRIGGGETDSELTGPVWSTGAGSSTGVDIRPETPLSCTMAGEDTSNSTPRCHHSSASQDPEEDVSDDSGDYESYLFLSPVMEGEAMELDHPFAELVDALATLAMDRFTSWLTDYSASCLPAQGVDAPPSSKRLKAECFSEHTKVDSRELAGEDDTVIVETPGSSLFACPFYLQDKAQHLRCLTRTDLRTIRDLKQHLWTAHRQPYYCPTCSSTFSRASVRDQHIKDRTCSPQQWNGPPQGLSEAQLQKLARRCEAGTTETNQWFDIWNLTNTPKADAPSPRNTPWTPYLTGRLESAVCITRDFWAQKGKFVIADFLEQRNLRDYNVRDEERNLAAMYQVTLDTVVDQLVQLFKDDDTHIGSNATMSNVLSCLRNFCSKWM